MGHWCLYASFSLDDSSIRDNLAMFIDIMNNVCIYCQVSNIRRTLVGN